MTFINTELNKKVESAQVALNSSENNVETLNETIAIVEESKIQETVTLNADESDEILKTLENETQTEIDYEQYVIESYEKELKETKDEFQIQDDKDGAINEIWNGVKEIFNFGVPKSEVENAIENQEIALEKLKEAKISGNYKKVYEEITGQKYDEQKLIQCHQIETELDKILNSDNPQDFEEEYLILSNQYKEMSNEYLSTSNELTNVLNNYADSQNNFIDKTAQAVQIGGMGMMILGGVACFVPGGQVIGAGMMKFGQMLALGGTFGDNALEAVDLVTNKQSFSEDKEEYKEVAKETLVDGALFVAGYASGTIAGKAGEAVLNNKKVVQVAGETGAKILSQVTDKGLDVAMSLASDATITGEVDLAGEGMSQFLGVLTGSATARTYGAKINTKLDAFINDKLKLGIGKTEIDVPEVEINAPETNKQRSIAVFDTGNFSQAKNENVKFSIQSESQLPLKEKIQKRIEKEGFQDLLKDSRYWSLDDFSEGIKIVHEKINTYITQVSEDYIIDIASKMEFPNSSVLINDLASVRGRNTFGNAVILNELLNEKVVTMEQLDELMGEVMPSSNFIKAYQDDFDNFLMAISTSKEQLNNLKALSADIQNGAVKVEDVNYLIKNIDNLANAKQELSESRFLEANKYNNTYYSKEEYIEFFNYFKNLKTPEGYSILGAGELASKMSENFAEGITQTKANEILFKNIDEILNIDPSSTQASYMFTMLELIQTGEINPSALRALEKASSLRTMAEFLLDANTGSLETNDKWVLSNNVKKDIDLLYETIIKNQDKTNLKTELAQSYTPTFKNENEALEQIALGESFSLEGENKIRIKTSDTTSQLMNISKERYYELFPPIERFASSQQILGDCYCIETLMSLYCDPATRSNVVKLFSEDEMGNLTIRFPNGPLDIKLKDGKLPQGDTDVYSSGALGFKLLEYAYGMNLYENQISKLTKALSAEELADFQDFASKHDIGDIFIYKKDGKYCWTTHKKAVEEGLHKEYSETIFSNHYNNYNNYLLGNGGIQYSVLNMFGIDSKLIIPFEDYETTLKGFKQNMPDDFEYTKEDHEEARKTTIETFAKTLKTDIQNDVILKTSKEFTDLVQQDGFFDEYTVQLAIQGHAYSLTKEVDSNGVENYYLFNPHNQSVPIKITDLDTLFKKEGLIMHMSIGKKHD